MKMRAKNLAEKKQNILMCRSCKRTFVTVDQKKRHLTVVHGGKHECSVCGKSFNSNKRLVQHEWSHTRKETKDVFKCEICASTFSWSRSLNLHYKIHYTHFKQVTFVCWKCRESFVDEIFLKHHMSTAHPNTTVELKTHTHTCAKCEKTYKNSWLLRAHEKYEHNLDNFPRYSCQHCSVQFVRIHNLQLHIMRSHGKPLPNKRKRLSSPDKNNKEMTATEEMANTEKKAKTEETADTVEMAKTEKMADIKEIDVMTCFYQKSSKFSCPVCVYSTERKNHFRRHLKGVHSIASSQSRDNISTLQMKLLHKCLKCNKMFARKDLLYNHDRLRHVQAQQLSKPNASRPLTIQCGVCKKNIPTGQLILHVNRHKHTVISKKKKMDMNDFYCEERKMYKCCFCSEESATHNPFAKHLQEVHNSNVVYDRHKNVREGFPFQCSKCSMRLASKFHWREHELRHKIVRKSRAKVKVEVESDSDSE